MKKWTKKISDYGTNGYFVSPFYGEDLAQAPDYDEVANPDGYGGPKWPLKSWEKFYQETNKDNVAIIDSSIIMISASNDYRTVVSDGITSIKASSTYLNLYGKLYGLFLMNIRIIYISIINDCFILSPTEFGSGSGNIIVSTPVGNYNTIQNNTFIYATPTQNNNLLGNGKRSINNIIVNSNLKVYQNSFGIVDFNIIIGKLNISFDATTYQLLTLAEIKAQGKMLKSFDMEDLGLRTNLAEDDSHPDNINDWKKLFVNPIDVDVQNYMYADFSISSQLWQRIKDNQIINHGKTVEEAESIATQGINYVLHGGQYGGYIGAKPVGHRIDADALWNTYKSNSTNLQLQSGILITTDNTQVGTYESLEIPLSSAIDIENGSLAHEVAYQLEGWVNARISGEDYEAPDNAVEQRTILTYQLDFYSNGAWTGFKTFEIGAPLRVDNSGNGNQDAGYVVEEAQVIPNVTKFKLRFEMRKHITA